MAAVEGVRNGAKNLDGIHYSAKAFPNSWTTAIVGGFLNACGSSFVLWMERHLRGTPALNDLNKPSGFVKLSFVVSLLAVVLLGTDSLPSLLPAVLVEYITEDVVHHLAFAVHIIFCIGAVVNKYFDPLSPLFSSLRLVFFGGISPSDDDHHHTHGRHPKPTAIDLEVICFFFFWFKKKSLKEKSCRSKARGHKSRAQTLHQGLRQRRQHRQHRLHLCGPSRHLRRPAFHLSVLCLLPASILNSLAADAAQILDPPPPVANEIHRRE